jgi:hypothetical protein
MKTVTYEATVENGQIKLPDTVHLPEHAKVFVVVPLTEEQQRFTVATSDDGLPVIRTNDGVITSQLVRDLETRMA